MESVRIVRASCEGAFYLSFPEEPVEEAAMRVAADILQRSSLLSDILAEASPEPPGGRGEEDMFSTSRGAAVVYSPPGYLRSWLAHVTSPSWIEAASVAQLLFVLQVWHIRANRQVSCLLSTVPSFRKALPRDSARSYICLLRCLGCVGMLAYLS